MPFASGPAPGPPAILRVVRTTEPWPTVDGMPARCPAYVNDAVSEAMTMDDPGKPVSGNLSGARVTLAALLAALSVGAIVVVASGLTASRDPSQVIVLVAPAAWVLAAIVLAPTVTAVNAVALVAVAGYAVAFLLPAISKGDDAYLGGVAFFVGWAVVPLAWAANPLFLISLALWRRGTATAAGVVGVVASLLALTALAMPNWNGWGPALGFWLWATAPGLVAIATIFVPRTGADKIDQARPLAA